MSVSIALAQRNATLDAAIDLLNGGYLRIYSGSVPANVDAALGGATLLAELRFGSPAFGAAASGTKTANAIASAAGLASGTHSFWRGVKSDGTTAIAQGTSGTAGTDLILDKTSISTTVAVNVTALTISFPG
jgi:hypothetical protein